MDTVSRNWLDTRAEYISVVQAFRQQQHAESIVLSDAEVDDTGMQVEETEDGDTAMSADAEVEGEQQLQTSQSDAD